VTSRATASDPTDSALLAAAAFRTELRRFLSRTEAVAESAGLTAQRYDLLLMVRSAGELRITDLCERLHLQQTAVTELVKRAEEAGLVTRKRSTKDRRVTLLRVTSEGERRLMRAFAALHDDREALGATFRTLGRRFRATAGHP
jgi:DNA-binding MarR family transcriptional regulator